MLRLFDWLSSHHIARKAPARRPTRAPRHRLSVFESLEGRDLLAAASVVPNYVVTQNWGSGFQGQITLNNTSSASIPQWQLGFDYGANITAIWDGTIASHIGNHYVIVGAGWNNTLAAGGSIAFGFNAAPGGSPTAPANYTLNGVSLSGSGSQPAPTLSIGSVSLNEGQSGTASALFSVTLSTAATTPITVKYATADGTAKAGSDYTAVSGTLTFAAGVTTQTIAVPVVGDSAVEPDETFLVNLSSPSGAVLAQAQGTGTIKNDDTATSGTGNFQFQVTTDWGSGFTGLVTIKNSSSAAQTNWQLAFDFAGTITSIWDAKVQSHVGNHYVVQNAGYNSTIPAGGSVTFGFNGSPGNLSVSPSNYVLTSQAGSTGGSGGSGGTGGNGGASQSPVATADLAYTPPGQAVVIGVLANDTDPGGYALAVAQVGQGAHGAVVLNPNNTVTYTPQAGFTGTDTFTYQVRDTQGNTATGAVTVNVAQVVAWPAHVFAPYVDMTLYPMYDLVTAAKTEGLRYFSLAFIVADSNNKPAWGGYSDYELGTTFDAQMKQQIAGVRALGGDVVVSFGGAANQELALVITNTTALQQAYQSVISAYGLTHIDFDIEGAAVADHASIDRRNQALAGLQQAAAAAGKMLDISYTLPVLPTGLTADGLYVLQSALRYGVHLGNVNVMAMDYGDSAAPNPKGQMGKYAIDAANSLFTQLKGLYGATLSDTQLWQMVGVTPMIGVNDAPTEVFTQQDAAQLLAFAQQKGIGRIAFWSLNRDRQNPSGALSWTENESSSLIQKPYEFSLILLPFTR